MIVISGKRFSKETLYFSKPRKTRVTSDSVFIQKVLVSEAATLILQNSVAAQTTMLHPNKLIMCKPKLRLLFVSKTIE